MKVKYKQQITDVIIQNNAFQNLYKYLDQNKKYLLLIDDNVLKLYLKLLPSGNNIFHYQITSLESNKTFETVQEIIKCLLNNNFTASDWIICLGGGIVSDLGGFVAHIYKRGIAYINIPTTLLAQVDSCLGGKTGCNYLGYKNQLGAIYHPSMIIVDPIFLNTLSKEAITSGMCEVIKYAVLFDKELFMQIKNNNYQMLNVIKKCLALKAKVTKADENDQDARKILNFGHTIGHAIEAKYHLLHGIAIGYGMYLESKKFNPHVSLEIQEILKQFGLSFDLEFTDLKNYIRQDKKIYNNKITLVKCLDIGQAVLVEGEIDEYF